MYEDDDLSFLHDEDSFHPNSVMDEDLDEDDDQTIMNDIIQSTLDELEEAADTYKLTVNIDKSTVLKALQLLKAYTTLYSLDYEDYEYNYDN